MARHQQLNNPIFTGITIEKLSHEGRGISHINGKTAFIDNALPDEVVDIKTLHQNKKQMDAIATHIHQASPNRVEPKCPHTDICGGCQIQHIAPDFQISFKQSSVLDLLKHTAKISLDKTHILPPLLGPIWGYRYKARLSVKYVIKKQKLVIGFHEKSGKFIADLSSCDVLHPNVGMKLDLIREVLSSLSIYQHIPQVEMACDKYNTVLIIRHLLDLSQTDKDKLKSFGQAQDFQIYLQPNKPQQLMRLTPLPNLIDPTQDFLSYAINDIQFKFFPTDFTQINPEINQQMVNLALKLLDLKEQDVILDLFCGLGNFSLPMAKHAGLVTGIEGDNQMVERARFNAKLNQLSNAQFYTANLFEPDAQWPWLNQHFTHVLLDPPRTGAIEMLPILSKISPQKILYVSCNPATFARDAGILINQFQYTLSHLGIMDMFPHTKHIETIGLFVKNDLKKS